ncbi:MAG: hypothetical protein ACM31E_01020 [Fibrobacterota bacterium]
MPILNQVAVTFTEEQITQIRGALQTLDTVLKPQLIQLGPQSRQELPKMGDKSIGFVSKTLEYAQSNPDFAPKYFNVNDALTDFRVVPVLREFSTTVNVLAEMLQDTMTASGSEAYAASLSYYNGVKAAVKDEQPGAKLIYDDLRSRFPRGTVAAPVAEATTAR